MSDRRVTGTSAKSSFVHEKLSTQTNTTQTDIASPRNHSAINSSRQASSQDLKARRRQSMPAVVQTPKKRKTLLEFQSEKNNFLALQNEAWVKKNGAPTSTEQTCKMVDYAYLQWKQDPFLKNELQKAIQVAQPFFFKCAQNALDNLGDPEKFIEKLCTLKNFVQRDFAPLFSLMGDESAKGKDKISEWVQTQYSEFFKGYQFDQNKLQENLSSSGFMHVRSIFFEVGSNSAFSTKAIETIKSINEFLLVIQPHADDSLKELIKNLLETAPSREENFDSSERMQIIQSLEKWLAIDLTELKKQKKSKNTHFSLKSPRPKKAEASNANNTSISPFRSGKLNSRFKSSVTNSSYQNSKSSDENLSNTSQVQKNINNPDFPQEFSSEQKDADENPYVLKKPSEEFKFVSPVTSPRTRNLKSPDKNGENASNSQNKKMSRTNSSPASSPPRPSDRGFRSNPSNVTNAAETLSPRSQKFKEDGREKDTNRSPQKKRSKPQKSAAEQNAVSTTILPPNFNLTTGTTLLSPNKANQTPGGDNASEGSQ